MTLTVRFAEHDDRALPAQREERHPPIDGTSQRAAVSARRAITPPPEVSAHSRTLGARVAPPAAAPAVPGPSRPLPSSPVAHLPATPLAAPAALFTSPVHVPPGSPQAADGPPPPASPEVAPGSSHTPVPLAPPRGAAQASLPIPWSPTPLAALARDKTTSSTIWIYKGHRYVITASAGGKFVSLTEQEWKEEVTFMNAFAKKMEEAKHDIQPTDSFIVHQNDDGSVAASMISANGTAQDALSFEKPEILADLIQALHPFQAILKAYAMAIRLEEGKGEDIARFLDEIANHPPVGIANAGNDCFLNSEVQSILRNPPLAQALALEVPQFATFVKDYAAAQLSTPPTACAGIEALRDALIHYLRSGLSPDGQEDIKELHDLLLAKLIDRLPPSFHHEITESYRHVMPSGFDCPIAAIDEFTTWDKETNTVTISTPKFKSDRSTLPIHVSAFPRDTLEMLALANRREGTPIRRETITLAGSDYLPESSSHVETSTSSPDALVVQIDRSNPASPDTVLNTPIRFAATDGFPVIDGKRYEILSADVRTGELAARGHFFTYLKYKDRKANKDRYFRLNDGSKAVELVDVPGGKTGLKQFLDGVALATQVHLRVAPARGQA